MTSFVLCGTGWRSLFFIRIASALKDEFRIASIYTHREDKMSELIEKGYKAYLSLDDALAASHDAVIVASGDNGFYSLLKELESRGETVLSETTFSSLSEEEMDDVSNMSGYTLEQYWHTPLYGSINAVLGKIGKIESVYLSALHNHHAASIMRGIFPSLEINDVRRLLDTSSRCLKTGSRKGLERGGKMEDYTRKITSVEFKTGEVFITDFSSNQYHSYIIPSRIEIRGERGVITEKGVTYISSEGYPVREDFVFSREESKLNHTPTLSHVTLGGEVVFKNDFYPLPFSDDEIAIASILREFSKGKLDYSIAEGVEDARIGNLF